MRTEQYNVYEFDELSDKAKDAARDWYRDGIAEYEWWDYTIEWMESELLPALGLDGCKVGFRLAYSQGDCAWIAGHYEYAKGMVSNVREMCPTDLDIQDIAVRLANAQKTVFYRVYGTIDPERRYGERFSMEIDGEPHRDHDHSDTIQVLRELEQWIYTRLRDEYEYLCEDSNVDESIVANGYEFLENGSPA